MEEVDNNRQEQELSQKELAQREIIEQQMAEGQQQGDVDIEQQYNDIIGETVGQTTYINEQATDIIPDINTEGMQNMAPITMKDADEVNKYFESLGNNITSLNNNVITTDLDNKTLIKETQYELNNYNIESNNIISADANNEDYNKYFQQNASTQNNNIDLASLGLQTGTQVQGATNEEDINKYFQNNEYVYGNSSNLNYSEYNVSNNNNADYNISNTNSNITYGVNQSSTNQFNEYPASQIQTNTKNISYVGTSGVTGSYTYNYNNPIQYNY